MYHAVPGRQQGMRRLYGRFIRPGDLCFDIGAHVGNRIRAWLGLGARVVAVEPQPQLLRWLRLLYGRHPRVAIIPAAVGAERGEITLHISSRTPTVSSVNPDWIDTVRRDEGFAWVEWDRRVTVPQIRLDDLIIEHGRPAFCKIDIEGHELAALHGLTQPLPALSFEHIGLLPAQTAACVDYLNGMGPYDWNFAAGESQQLLSEDWLTGAALLAQLPAQGSGDVYGRLAPAWFTG
jgi:FkbM family methyltransferase